MGERDLIKKRLQPKDSDKKTPSYSLSLGKVADGGSRKFLAPYPKRLIFSRDSINFTRGCYLEGG